MTRTIFFVGFTTGAVALILACSGGGGDSSSSSSSGGTSTSSGSAGAASGSGGTTSGAASSSSGASGFKQCGSTSSGSTTCTEAETKTYSDCVIGKCDSKYKECYGGDYQKGTFGGACGTWISCTQKCACNDTNCTTACGTPDSACTNCILGSASCSNGCTVPACYGTTGTSSSGSPPAGTCADLGACCAKLTGTDKSTCDTVKANSGNSDLVCGSYLSSIKSKCP